MRITQEMHTPSLQQRVRERSRSVAEKSAPLRETKEDLCNFRKPSSFERGRVSLQKSGTRESKVQDQCLAVCVLRDEVAAVPALLNGWEKAKEWQEQKTEQPSLAAMGSSLAAVLRASRPRWRKKQLLSQDQP